MNTFRLAKISILAAILSGALFLPQQALADGTKAKATKVISVHLNSGGVSSTITSEPIINSKGKVDDGQMLLLTTTEEPSQIKIEAQIEKMDPTDIDVNITDHEMSIKGHRQNNSAKNDPARNGQLVTEHSFGSFQRTFSLAYPVESKHARASIKDGKLLIVLPKKASPGEEL